MIDLFDDGRAAVRGEPNLSVRTVETHRSHIMQKLRPSTRAEFVRHALEHGLLEED